MRDDREIEKLKTDIFSENWEKMKVATDRMFEIGGQENIDYLIGLLDQSNLVVRNAVSLTFRKNKFNKALEPLLNSIYKKEYKGYNGTLVYALETLDCSKKLSELFDILFEDNSYEVQYHVLTILDKQIFEFTSEDLLGIKTKWDNLKNNWNEKNKIDPDNLKTYDLDRDLIQNFVDRFT